MQTSKTLNLNSVESIVTHPGVFHADEICAVAWLRIAGAQAPVERRRPTYEEQGSPRTLVIDVGGRHDADLGNFDHHQKGGAGARWDSEVPYASFGLAYDAVQPIDPAVAQRFHDRMVLPVDAVDCGWGTKEGTRPSLSFSACVSGFNPGPSASAAERDEAFETAVRFARQVLENELRSAEQFVAAKQAVMDAHTADAGRVLILEQFVPWQEHLFSREDQARVLYVVFPSLRGGWCVQQVPVEPGSFEGRKPLPEAWAGLKGQELAERVGLNAHGPATFCHPGRFIAGGENREDALALAARAVEA